MIKYWFPVQFKDVLRRTGIEWTNSYFYLPDRNWDTRIDYCIDFTKKIFRRWSVVQYCIQLAVYMGVKCIYLLGCEETGIISYLQSLLTDTDYEYAYQIESNDLHALKNYVNCIDIHRQLYGYSNIFKGYGEMNELCINNGVALYTCAKKTLVRDIEYCSFDDAIAGEV